MNDNFRWLAVVAGIFLASCALGPGPRKPRWIKATVPFSPSRPESLADIRCVGLNVVGEGIPSTDGGDPRAEWKSVAKESVCSYPGISTSLSPLKEQNVSFAVNLPSGSNRVVQVLGLKLSSGDCPTETIGELLMRSRYGKLDSQITGIFEVGKVTTDITESTQVTIRNNYAGAAAQDLRLCDGAKAVEPLVAKFKTMSLVVRDRVTLSATGGFPPYSYSVENGTGIVEKNNFIAPSTVGSTQFITRDSRGNTVSTPLNTFKLNAGGLLYQWYSAGEFWDAETTSLWKERNSGAANLAISTINPSAGAVFSTSGGPNDMPYVTLPPQHLYSAAGSLVAINTAEALVYLVARPRTEVSPQDVFCLTDGAGCASTGNFMGITGLIGIVNLALNKNSVPTLTPAPYSTGWTLFRGHWKSAAGQTFTVAGTSYNTPNSMTNLVLNPITAQLFLGSQSNQFALDVAELIIYQGMPGDDADIHSGLRTKYNLP